MEINTNEDKINKNYQQIDKNNILFRVSSFFVVILYLETVYKFLVYDGFTGKSLLFVGLFSLLGAILLTFLTGLFSMKVNRALLIFLSVILVLVYCSQYIYYGLFKTPMLVFSILQAKQVAEFSTTAFQVIGAHIPELLLFFLPLAGVLFGFKRCRLPRLTLRNAATLLCNGLVVYGVLMIVLALSGTGTNSAYNLYYNDDVPLLTQQELGVAPAMAMDLCRTVFGFSPKDDSFVSDPAEIKDLLAVDQAKPQPQPIVYPPNALPIDFDALMASTQDTELGDMHHYFSVVPPTLQNSYTGIFADCNLIYIVAEGFSQYLLNPTLCPTLYRLSSEGLQFTNFYTALWNVSTSDGEYVACTGLVPKSGCWSFSKSADNYLPFCLGNQFSQQGYATPRAYHNNTYTYYDRDQSHPNMGYIYHGLGNGLNVRQDWPESDLEMMELSIPEYIHEDRFHAYYMTVSGHLQYNFSGNVQARKHQAQVADLPYSEEAKAYIACNLELEQAMKYLLDQLEAANKLDNTVIVLSADHYPYGLSKQTIDEFAGHPVDENFELYRNGLIIWKSGMAHQVIEDPGSSMDILPTVSNLFGLPYDSRLLMGRDLFSTSSPLVIFNNRSWITDQASYNAATGVYSGTVGQEYLDAINKIVANKVHYAAQILDKDYYAIVFGQKQQ